MGMKLAVADRIETCAVLRRPEGPVAAINGHPVFLACHYLRNYKWELQDDWPRGVMRSVRQFAARGIRRFELSVCNGWTDAGFDPGAGAGCYPVDAALRAILAAEPHAHVLLRLGVTPPPEWLAQHPDERECDQLGSLYELSFASDTGFTAVAEALTRIVRHVETAPYGGRVIGYNIHLQFEGVPLGSMTEGAMTDYSPAMRRAFREYLRRSYGSDDALRAAWGVPDVDLATVEPPTPGEHLGESSADIFHHPVHGRKARDYYALMDELTVRRHRQVAGAVKDACAGLKLVGMMGGYTQAAGEPRSIASPTGFPELQLHKHHFSGPGSWGRLFEAPEIDFFFAPTDYRNTGMGGCCLILNMPASQRLHDKLSFMEDDQRTHLHRAPNWNPGLATAAESVAAHRRNAALLYTEADICNWMEQADNWLLDDAILDNLGELNRFLQTGVSFPSPTPDAICVLIDEDSQGWTKPTTRLDEVLFYHQRNGGLTYCGVPVRYHLLSDLAHDDFPDYKCYLLPNLYRATREKEAWLDNKVRRNGNLLIWLYGAGYVGEREFSTSTMHQLTGIRLGVHPYPWEHRIGITNWDHPITRDLPADLTFGTDRHYGPIFHVDDPNACILGRSFGFGMTRWPALAIKGFGRGARGGGSNAIPYGAGDYASVYCEAPNLPASLLRGLARYAGCHVYLDSDDVVIVGKDLVMIHAVKPGPRRLHLPREMDVSDALSGEPIVSRVREISLMITGPETRLFRLKDQNEPVIN